MHRIIDFLQRQRLESKLWAGFGFVLLVALVIGLRGLYDLGQMNQEATQLYERNLLGVSHVKEARVNLIYLSRSLRQITLATDSAQRALEKRRLERARAAVTHELEEASKRTLTEENARLLK